MNQEALYYELLCNNRIRCLLCPLACVINPGETSNCKSRINIDGKLYAFNFGEMAAINLDPIEKKPLYHYYPGSKILSLGPNSCNLHCVFCQNHDLSQSGCKTTYLSSSDLLETAIRNNVKSVAFTYTEPITVYEYIMDCGKLFKQEGLKLVLVTNGYINQGPLKKLLPYIDAMNIDLKSMTEDFYRNICKGSLAPVLETIRIAAEGCHLEITNLLIPELNDGIDEIDAILNFISHLNPNIPLHFSRYFPNWKCHQPATSIQFLISIYERAKKMLNYVYLGNILESGYSVTLCPVCKTKLIERDQFNTVILNMKGSKCSICENDIYGRF
jgi:pyruvate formate lyase activating enzyme